MESPLGVKRAAKHRDSLEYERQASGAEAGSALVSNRGHALQRQEITASRADSVGVKDEAPKKEPKLSVLDLRKSSQAKKEARTLDSPTDDTAATKTPETKISSSETKGELVRELSLDTRLTATDRSAGGSERAAPGSPASDFRALLAERLQEAWNGEIVQSARIVLRDGDSGTIRLRLKPESLGTVKIELNLADNNISGRIIVESDEAKSAFERNMSELADAFRRGGFESARLQVSVGSDSGSGGKTDGGTGEGPFYSERLRAAVDSGAVPSIAQTAYVRQGSAIDMLA